MMVSQYLKLVYTIYNEFFFREHERIDHGQVKHFLFTSSINIQAAVQIELKWKYDDHVYNPGTYCWAMFCNRSLYIDTVQVSAINYYPER